MIESLKTDIEGVLNGITGIGLVEDEGRTENLPWEGDTFNPLWNVHFEAGNIKVMSGSDDIASELNFAIRGYMPCSFPKQTSDKWIALIDLIIDAFVAQKRFSGISLIQSVDIKQNDYVMYGAQNGGVLCHFALINISIRYID